MEQDKYSNIVDYVKRFHSTNLETRRSHEIQWYINTATIRNLIWVNYEPYLNRIDVAKASSEKTRNRSNINLVLPMFKARQSKFLKNPFEPVVLPATSDPEDIQDARATKQALEFIWRKEKLEAKYKDTLNWANTCSKGYWWLHWNPSAIARQYVKDELTGQETLQEFEGGDVEIEVGSPFEVLVADPSIPYIGDQPEIMRVRLRDVKELEAQYQLPPNSIKPTETVPTDFVYKRTIASLSPRGPNMDSQAGESQRDTHTLVYEWFKAPCVDYPQGRYVVVAGDTPLKDTSLPYGFHDMVGNPYPVVEFPDQLVTGQYWNPTLIENILPLNREYNLVRTMIVENFKLMCHPKILIDARHGMPEDSWQGGVAGEKIPIYNYPGIPPPQVISPTNIASDAWQLVRLIKDEIHDLMQIWPSNMGDQGGAASGFQTNLLQEANESVHQPDVRLHQLAMEEACRKIRRMMKLGYDVPRLLAVVGKTTLPDVVEFSQQDIDEHADIIIWTGSALSSSPAVRNQQALEMFTSGLLGNQQDPQVQRDTLAMIDMNGFGRLRERYMRDEEMAKLENQRFEKGLPATWPGPWEDHEIQYRVHADQLKSPELELWSDEAKMALQEHLVYHAYFIEPSQAMNMANEIGRPELVQLIMEKMVSQQQIAATTQQFIGGPPPQEQQQQEQPQQGTPQQGQ
jgi:hypothetical protein